MRFPINFRKRPTPLMKNTQKDFGVVVVNHYRIVLLF